MEDLTQMGIGINEEDDQTGEQLKCMLLRKVTFPFYFFTAPLPVFYRSISTLSDPPLRVPSSETSC